MADFRRRAWIMRNRPSITPRIIDEEITPSSGWTDNPDFHCLLVDLPGFKKDDIKFNVNESGVIVVSGRKRIGEKQVHFEKKFDVPENGDVKSLKVTFEGDTLKIVILKVDKEKKDAPETMNGASSSAEGDQNKEVMALPSTKDEEKQEQQESLALGRDTRQESERPPSDHDTKAKTKEEAKKLDSSSDIMDEKKEEEKQLDSSSDIMDEKKEEAKQSGSSSDIMEEKKEEARKPNSSSDIVEKKKEEAKKPESSSDIIEEQKEEAKKPDSSSGVMEGRIEEEKKQDSSSDLMEEKKEEAKKLDSSSDIMEKQDMIESKEKKVERESHREESKEKSSEHQKEHIDGEEGKKISEQKEGPQKTVIVKIIENKGILLASIISFTLGVLLSKKFHGPSPN